jgi:hypothetical protein
MNPFGKTTLILSIKNHSHNLGVPLRKNFGSGYPLYLLGRTPPQEDAAPIPHAKQQELKRKKKKTAHRCNRL